MGRPRTVADEEVLDAAAAAIGTTGPAAVTLAEIGSRVGLAPATLIQRFGSKRGVLLAVARYSVTTLPTQIKRAEAEVQHVSAGRAKRHRSKGVDKVGQKETRAEEDSACAAGFRNPTLHTDQYAG